MSKGIRWCMRTLSDTHCLVFSERVVPSPVKLDNHHRLLNALIGDAGLGAIGRAAAIQTSRRYTEGAL